VSYAASTDAKVVIIDDHAANVALLRQMLGQWGYTNLVTTTDSSEALDLCRTEEPDLVLLDLMMPPPDGFEIMQRLAASSDASYLPILVLSGDVSETAKARALELGAKDFLGKPFDASELRLRVGNLLETRRLYQQLQHENESLEQRVRARTRSLERARLEILERLSLAGEYRDDETNEHAQRVGRTAAQLARALGLRRDRVELIRRAAPLHDIGKIGIPDAILLKPDRLTPDERKVMQSHVEIGSRILDGSSSPTLKLAEEIARTHHEWWSGGGYPAGLAGEEIPITGRMVALADVYDALTHRRPYKEAFTIEHSVSEIRQFSGSHFDPKLVEAFETLDPEELLAPIAPTVDRAVAG
jgi:putative two-component system response regulator